MKITNKYNLPQALVDLVASGIYEPKADSFSATTILNPVKQTLLIKEHWDEIEVDVSDRVNALLGTATHSLIEKFDKTGYAELYMKEPIKDGYFLTGKCDLYDAENMTLVDYKTATCWKIIYKDFEDWKKQGLIYAWLLARQGKLVVKLKFHAILKDWTAREKRLADFQGNFYPESQVWTWEYDVKVNDLIDIENFIYERFSALTSDSIPDCTPEETWYTGDKYAVYKKLGDARAMKVCDTEEEANNYVAAKGGVIVYRQGEHRRCQDYCDVYRWCKGGE